MCWLPVLTQCSTKRIWVIHYITKIKVVHYICIHASVCVSKCESKCWYNVASLPKSVNYPALYPPTNQTDFLWGHHLSPSNQLFLPSRKECHPIRITRKKSRVVLTWQFLNEKAALGQDWDTRYPSTVTAYQGGSSPNSTLCNKMLIKNVDRMISDLFVLLCLTNFHYLWPFHSFFSIYNYLIKRLKV